MKAEIEYANPELFETTMENLDKELNSVLEKLLAAPAHKNCVNFTSVGDDNNDENLKKSKFEP